MTKLVILAAFICMTLASASPRGSSGGRDNHHGSSDGGNDHRGPAGCSNNTLASTVCGNSTVAQSFEATVKALITTLVNNGSFTDFFRLNAQKIAYIQNSTNTALLTSNCTAFFTGLSTAELSDQTAEQTRQQYTMLAQQKYDSTIFNLTGIAPGNNKKEMKH